MAERDAWWADPIHARALESASQCDNASASDSPPPTVAYCIEAKIEQNYLKNTAKQLVVVDVVGLPVQLHVSLNGDVRRLLVRDKERLEGYGSQGGRPPLAIDCPLPRSSSLFSLKCTRGYLGYDGPDR